MVTPANRFVCDGGKAIVAFAHRAKIPVHVVPAPGKPSPEAPDLHINNVNAYHGRLKKWMRRLHGVATRTYLGWRRALEAAETKSRRKTGPRRHRNGVLSTDNKSIDNASGNAKLVAKAIQDPFKAARNGRIAKLNAPGFVRSVVPAPPPHEPRLKAACRDVDDRPASIILNAAVHYSRTRMSVARSIRREE